MLAAKKKSIAQGNAPFVVVAVFAGLATQVAVELLGSHSVLVGQVATFVVAIPLAVLAARRLGSVSRGSLLFGSALVAAFTLWVIVYTLNSIGEPVGSPFGWPDLLNRLNWRNSVFGTLAMLAVPQLWLVVLGRMAANNSSKPTPLRGAA